MVSCRPAGYGFAARGKEQRDRLMHLIQDYILDREQLACLFVLVDIRHDPQKIDLEFMDWLGEHDVPFAIVFTKADKLGPVAAQRKVDSYCKELLLAMVGAASGVYHIVGEGQGP